jgi:hypothetical protein
MSCDVNQGRIIKRLNAYLEWHNIPIHLDKKGVCNGLTCLYIKYALQGHKDEFLSLLEYIVEKNPDSEMEDKVNQLVYEVILTCTPGKFEKDLNQANAMGLLNIKKQPIKSSFDFALATSDENWAEIIQKIDLHDNEVMRVSSINHVVAVTKIGREYLIYDPNYPSGVCTFDDEEELIKELRTHVFDYNKGPLGLMIHVIRPPEDEEIRKFPKVCELYDTYLTQENINDEASIDGQEYDFSTLGYAVYLNDEKIISQLINKGAVDKDNIALIRAILFNQPKTISVLLHNNSDVSSKKQQEYFFLLSLVYGHLEVFDELMKHYKQIPLNTDVAVVCAANGRNTVLLEKVIEYCKPDSSTLATAIFVAAGEGRLQNIKLLMHKLDELKEPLTHEDMIECLLEAITKNRFATVHFFLNKIPPQLCQTISLSTLAAEKTELAILRMLKSKDVVFSGAAEAVFARKERQPVDFFTSLGILWCKFTDFLKELLWNDSGISCSAPESSFINGTFFAPEKKSNLPPQDDNLLLIPVV